MIADVEGEPSGVKDITEGHGQAKSHQKDTEADAIIERA
jgi:hypothetical protein